MAWALGKYIKTALMNRWNLLALAGGAAFSLLSGHADVFLPLVAAGELAYLGFVGTHPKFQTYVDVQQASQRAPRRQPAQRNDRTASRILKALSSDARDRFKRLRSRCLDLQDIARDMKQSGDGFGLDSMQLASLDKLLWIFLRLQFTQHSLDRFLQRTDADRIQSDIRHLEQRLGQLQADDDSPHAAKIRSTLEDNLQTSRARLDNYRKAEANFEYVELELDRLETKIKSLAELAVNRQEPEFITSQVDLVARSMLDTEETINELDFVTHLGPVEEQPPELLRPTIYITD